MPEPTNDIEQQLRTELLRADIENKPADTAYKNELSRWEPWKVVFLAFRAGAGTVAAIVGLMTAILK